MLYFSISATHSMWIEAIALIPGIIGTLSDTCLFADLDLQISKGRFYFPAIINLFRLEKLSRQLKLLLIRKALIKFVSFRFIHKIPCRCFILSGYAV